MKIVVVGGTGLVGSKVVEMVGKHRHEAVPASPASSLIMLPTRVEEGILVNVYDDKDSNERGESAAANVV